MQSRSSDPQLYGLNKEISSRHGKSLWGKNQFNSTFPLSLALYMRDENVNPVSIIAKSGVIVPYDNYWQMADVIGQVDMSAYYEFEGKFPRYEAYSRNNIDKIDLVIWADSEPFRPLEIKLTVVPDSTTANDAEHN